MTLVNHVLWTLVEECEVVAQRASRAARHGMDAVLPGQDLSCEAHLQDRLSGLVALVEVLAQERGLTGMSREVIEAKKAGFQKVFLQSQEEGFLQGFSAAHGEKA